MWVDWTALLLALVTTVFLFLFVDVDFMLKVGALGGCVYLTDLLWRAVLERVRGDAG